MNIDGVRKTKLKKSNFYQTYSGFIFQSPVIKVSFTEARVRKVIFSDVKRPKAPIKEVVKVLPAVLRPKNLAIVEPLLEHEGFFRQIYYSKLPVVLTVLLLTVGFVFGVWFNHNTLTTDAQNVEPPVATPPGSITMNLGPVANVPNEVLFNMPLSQLEIYLDSLAKQPAEAAAKLLAERKQKIKQFLEEKKSPLAAAADTIAEQDHWKLILAISFAESTLGKNCADNNCSNIGVAPGNPIWRKYASLDDWVIDFNGLLNRRYKDWTLDEMNGVYVKPKNPNWLLATKQILDELDEKDIQ